VNTHLLSETDLIVTTTGNNNVCDSAILGALSQGNNDLPDNNPIGCVSSRPQLHDGVAIQHCDRKI
jgi:hypothetical protein